MKISAVVLGLLMYMKKHMPYICMVICNLAFAGMALFAKAAISKGMNPYVFGVYRQAFATLALAPFAFFLERNYAAALPFNLLCKIFLASSCGITLSINLFNLGMSYIPATFVTATANAIPAITLIMATIFRMESISIRQLHGVAKVLGCTLCVCGALVITFVKGPPLILHPTSSATQKGISEPSTKMGCKSKEECLKGSFIILSGQTAWSLWLVTQGHLVKLYPNKLRLITLQCFFSGIQSTIWAVAVDRKISSWKLGWNLNLLAVAYCGVIFTGLTYWLRVWVVEKRGPVFTAAFTPLALIITAIFSAFLWKEIPHWGSVCGFLVLVGGLYGVLWGKHKEAKTKPVEQISERKNETVISDKEDHKQQINSVV